MVTGFHSLALELKENLADIHQPKTAQQPVAQHHAAHHVQQHAVQQTHVAAVAAHYHNGVFG